MKKPLHSAKGGKGFRIFDLLVVRLIAVLSSTSTGEFYFIRQLSSNQSLPPSFRTMSKSGIRGGRSFLTGDIHCLPVNPLSQRGVYGSSLHQIHLGYPKDFFNSMFHPEKVKDPHRAIEFNEEVNIASLSRLIPDNRSEKGKRGHSHFLEFFLMGS
jgi:hypothetical protein